jgi:small subunit ribosomal protein S13
MFYLTRCECVNIVSKLCQIYGIGKRKASQLCAQIGISETHNRQNGHTHTTLTRFQLDQLNQFISLHYTVDSELRRTITHDIKRTQSCGSYRGLRHTAGLPVRGQRTHTNARTQCRLSRLSKVYTK